MVEYLFTAVVYKNFPKDSKFYGEFKNITGAKRYAAGLIQAGFDEVIIFRPSAKKVTYRSVGKVKKKDGGIYYTNDGLKFSPINMDGRKSKSRLTEWEV